MVRSSTRRQYLATGSIGLITAAAGCNEMLQDDEGEDSTEDGGEAAEPDENDEGTGGNEDDGASSDEPPVEDVDHENPDGSVSVVTPEDGDEVTSPVDIEMEVEEFELQPADDGGSDDQDDEGDPDEGAGHMHVIVDHGCVEPEYIIPQEDGYHHLSDGERETRIELEPGEYDLCIQAGDDMHAAYDLTDEVTIEVTENDESDDEDA